MGDTHGDVAQAKVLSLAVHELRTPMSVFNGYVRMILKDPAGTLDDKYRSWLQEAEKASVRLTALVAEMSDVSALEAGKAPFKRVRVDVHAMLADAVAAVPEVPERRVDVQLMIGNGVAALQGDVQRLKTAFTSIFFRQRREIIDNGRVVIRERSGTFRKKPALWIAVAASDQIDGVDGVQEDAVEAYDEWQEGYGLSLTMARRIFDRHGGGLWRPVQGPQGSAVVALPLN